MLPEKPPPMLWRVQVATAGVTTNGVTYPLDVLRRCAHAYDKTFVRLHPRRRDHRIDTADVGSLVGLLRNPRPNATGVEAVLDIFPAREDVARMLHTAWLRGGLSPASPPSKSR